MELHQLRYFIAVADLRSFTKAAERCFVAQPSLSQQIIKLEKELGRPVFERLGRTVRLTEAGQSLYERAVTIVASVEEAGRHLAQLDGDESGTIAVGVIPTVAPYLLAPIVHASQTNFPRARLQIHEDFTERLVANCLRGELDVAILALPVAEPSLHVEQLFDEELLLALPRRHPLLERGQIRLEDLDGHPFILLSEAHCLGQQVLSVCNEQSCRPMMTCRSAQLLTVQELVAAGHGVSLVPEMACELDRDPRRHYRRFSGHRPTRTLAMIWHRHRYQRPIVNRFMELIRVHADKRPHPGKSIRGKRRDTRKPGSSVSGCV